MNCGSLYLKFTVYTAYRCHPVASLRIMFANFKRLVGSQTPVLAVTSAEAPLRLAAAHADVPGEKHGQMPETFDLLEVDVTRLISEVIAAAGATHKDMS